MSLMVSSYDVILVKVYIILPRTAKAILFNQILTTLNRSKNLASESWIAAVLDSEATNTVAEKNVNVILSPPFYIQGYLNVSRI